MTSTIEKKLPAPPLSRISSGSASHSSAQLTLRWSPLNGMTSRSPNVERNTGDERANDEAHFAQDPERGNRGMRGHIDRDTAVEPRQRRDIEVIVVLVAQDDGVDRRKCLGPKDSGRMDAVFEGVNRAEFLAEERIDEHARRPRTGRSNPDGQEMSRRTCRIVTSPRLRLPRDARVRNGACASAGFHGKMIT